MENYLKLYGACTLLSTPLVESSAEGLDRPDYSLVGEHNPSPVLLRPAQVILGELVPFRSDLLRQFRFPGADVRPQPLVLEPPVDRGLSNVHFLSLLYLALALTKATKTPCTKLAGKEDLTTV